MNVLTIVGARPQFVKAAVVSRAIARHNKTSGIPILEKIIHTGQHFDPNMSEVFFTEMKIPEPTYRLEIGGLGHGAMTGRMLEQIESVILNEAPDWVLVYGDTNSTLAGALAACKLETPVAHVEAGLRSFNMEMPEEINRVLVDRVANLLLCPTDAAMDNLIREGIRPPAQHAHLTGDVMYDAALYYAASAPDTPLSLKGTNIAHFALCTLHRAGNTDSPTRLKNIISSLGRIARELPVVLPLHPRTRTCLMQGAISVPPGIHVINPVGYLEMLSLLRACSVVLTDSGGVQKEAYFFEKNCVTLREETEWIELVKEGCNLVVGSEEKNIYQGFLMASNTPFNARKGIYGDGKAGERVVDCLMSA